MSVKTKVKKAAGAAAATSLLTVGMLAGTAGSAAAASNTVTVCAYGNYTIYATVPQQGYAATTLIYPGQCGSIGVADSTYYANVWGLYNTHPDVRFYVGTAHFSGSAGWFGHASGTTTAPELINLDH
ncbi:hypothetical protein ACWD3J_39895 [Streptomyces sp. NPDC002755]